MQTHEGFVFHVGGPRPSGGWRVVEVWETKEDSEEHYEWHVKPYLPANVGADRKYSDIHTALAKKKGTHVRRDNTVYDDVLRNIGYLVKSVEPFGAGSRDKVVWTAFNKDREPITRSDSRATAVAELYEWARKDAAW